MRRHDEQRPRLPAIRRRRQGSAGRGRTARRAERVDGIAIYTDAVLVRRKLATIIGEKPREAARDVYDAGWIITQHPELLDGLMRTKLRAWLRTIDDRRTRRLRRRLERDKRTRRVSATEVLALLEESILAL